MTRLHVLRDILPGIEHAINLKSSGPAEAASLDTAIGAIRSEGDDADQAALVFDYIGTLQLEELRQLRRRVCIAGLHAIDRSIKDLEGE